jgi:hypothetical protein
MSQQDDLGFQSRLRLERRDQDVDEQDHKRDHCGSAYLISPLTPADEVFGKDSHRRGDEVHEVQLNGNTEAGW